MVQARLDGFSGNRPKIAAGPEHLDILRRIRASTAPAMANLNGLLAAS